MNFADILSNTPFMKFYFFNSKAQLLSACGLVLVTIIEALTTMEMATGVLYLACILLLYREKRKVIISFAAMTLCLIYVNFLIFYKPSDELNTALVNRLISMVAIAVATYMSLTYRKLVIDRLAKEQAYAASIEQMLYITSHKVRSPACSIMGLLDLADPRTSSPEELSEIWGYVRNAATEMDTFTRELNDYVHKLEVEHSHHEIVEASTF